MALFGRPSRNPPPPAAKEPEAPVVVPALTKEDIAAAVAAGSAGIKAELENKIAELRGALDAGSRGQVPAPVAPTAPTRPVITDEDIENAIAAGTGAGSRVRALVDNAVSQLNDSVTRQINEITSRGLSSIANVTREVVLNKLPKYKKYQKEIDAKVASLPAAAQADPEVLTIVYNSVLGQHSDDIEREAREAALRRDDDPPTGDDGAPAPRKTANAPGAGGRGSSKSVPTFEEYVGVEGAGCLKDKDPRSGVKDGDSYAASLGYESWAHMMQAEEDARADAEKLGITLR